MLVLVFWIHRIHVGVPVEQDMGNLDITHAYLPWTEFLGRELRSGNLPLWNPYQMAGQPFLAMHVAGILYPPTLILSALLPAPRALEATALLHIFLAGFFTYLYARRIGLGLPAGVAGAIGYLLSGPILCGIYTPGYLIAAAWLPGVLWALHGLLSEVRAKWAVWLAVALGCSFLGGHAQGLLFIAQFGVLYGLVGLATLTPRPDLIRVLGLVALAGVVTVGLVAPQLFPALEFVSDGVRGFEGHGSSEVAYPSASPDMVLRGLIGGLGQDLSIAAAFPFRRTFNPELAAPYSRLFALPLLGLPLILCGLLARGQRINWGLFAASAAVTGLFLVGTAAPVFELYSKLPWGTLFRGSLRIDFLYAFVLTILIAIGVQGVCDWLEQRSAATASRTAAIVGAGLVLALGIDLYGKSELKLAHPVSRVRPETVPEQVLERMRRDPGRQRIFLESSWYAPVVYAKTGMRSGFFSVPDYEPNMPRQYESYFEPDFPFWGPWHGQVSLVDRRSRRMSLQGLLRRLDLMSVRYYGLPLPIEPGFRDDYRSTFPLGRKKFGSFELATRAAALPRVYAVGRVIPAENFEAALRRIEDAGFQPRREAVVTTEGSTHSAFEPLQGNDLEALEAEATITSFATEEVSIDARCSAPCLLVLTDLHYAGWTASVDGQATDIRPTNALFRGVVLEPGLHRIEFRFEPTSYRAGLAVFAITLIAIAGGFACGRSRPRRPGRPDQAA